MKKAILFFSVFAVSCTAMKQFNNEQIKTEKGCETLDLSKGASLIKVWLENKEQTFLFDTGAAKSTINDSTIIKDFSQKEFASLGSTAGADKKDRIANRNFAVEVKTAWFESSNKVFTLLQKPKPKCEGTAEIKGIIGLDCFFEQDYPLLFNFTDGKVCNIDQTEMKNHLANKAFKEIKSQCKLNRIYIFLTIAGKEYKFLFDTGFSGQIIMPTSDKVNLANYNSMQLDGSLFQTATGTSNGLETYYEKVTIGFAGQKIPTKPILSETAKQRLFGINLIKGFDWIIDYNNNKVYAKRNHIKIENELNREVSYYAKAGEKLLIIVKESRQTQYNLGDEIISVNGQKVTSENSCEMQNLLNSTDDWSTLDLDVIPATK